MVDFMNKSITTSYNTLNPYITPVDQERVNKMYSERDIFQISNKFVTKDEWDSIFNYISKSPSFHTLSVEGINIDSYGLKRLAEILSFNSYIKTFKLMWNYLNEHTEDFDNLCEVIARGNSLIYLHLNNNKLNSLQMGSICKILKNSPTILLIDLRWNEIGVDGGKELTNALANNTVIQELNLTGNKISPELQYDINDKINRNKNYVYNINFSSSFCCY